jgi:signal transduction histidine kinase/putative methionine-R-sulfoxide reductase with GAF domain
LPTDSNLGVTERRQSRREQAALRRIAGLVAKGAEARELFDVVAEEVGRVVDAPSVSVVRYERDSTVTVFGTFPPNSPRFPAGTRVRLDGVNVLSQVRDRLQPARLDDFTELDGEMGEVARSSGMGSSVGVPISVAGRIWGVIIASHPERLPESTEVHLSKIVELLAAAIADTEGREVLKQVADEQAALRRVATLVAQGAPPQELFAVLAEQVARVVDAPFVAVARYDSDDAATVCGSFPRQGPLYRTGARVPLEGVSVLGRIGRHGEPARIDDYTDLEGEVAAAARRNGLQCGVGVPIVVAGQVWGSIVAWSTARLPDDFEARLGEFTELIAAAISNAEATEALEDLADEQAALRRVATLVAKGATPTDVFAAVSVEVDRLLGLVPGTFELAGVVRFDPGPEHFVAGVSRTLDVVPLGSRWPPSDLFAPTRVLRTGRSARVGEDDLSVGGPEADFLRENGYLCQVASPIVVDGRLWGAISANAANELPADTEHRLEKFIELIATAVANMESQKALHVLADEQAALRRVATLVARDAPPGEVFDAVALEVSGLLDADMTVVGRYDGDGAATAIGSWSARPGGVAVGTRSAVGGRNVMTLVAETEQPARIDGYDDASGEAADIARSHGWSSSIAAPIIVEGGLWGVMLVATQRGEPFPPGSEGRLAAFTDLVATALANAQAHDAVRRFGEEQAALGRVATLVAGGAAPEQVFGAVVDEVSRLLALERIELVRYDGDETGTVIAASGDHPFPAGSTWSLADPSVMAMVARTRRAARIDDYSNLEGEIAHAARGAGFRSAIGTPVTVDGRLWGAIIAISTDREPIPERSQTRLGQFTELVATAVANADARHALESVAAEQATLRRIATLIATGVQPEEVFAAVTDEVASAFRAIAGLLRFDHDALALVVVGAMKESDEILVPVGTRWALDDAVAAAEVYRTGRSARSSPAHWVAAEGPIAEVAHRLGTVSAVASPIVVEGGLWGVMTVGAREELPPATEQRLEKFTELVSTAIANAEAKSELAASRRRIMTAADEARRRIQRDLHDGIQQRLIALTLNARAMTQRPLGELPGLIEELAEGLDDASAELREVSRGIHPTILSKAGLEPALKALARRSSVPVELDVSIDERLPAPVEAAAYYVASEALTNVAKHAQASVVELTAVRKEETLTLEVRDDGIGGADENRGSGIVGLTDRVEALGGTISIDSPPRGGTSLSVRLPLGT